MSILGEAHDATKTQHSNKNVYLVKMSDYDIEIILKAIAGYAVRNNQQKQVDVIIDKIYESMGFKAK